MKTIALIPARYEATRFPGKLMALLGGKSVILTTYQESLKTELFDEVIVVTDSIKIYDEITQNKGKAIMSQKQHECGTDRIAESAQNIHADIIVNIQGDEPFTNKKALKDLLKVFKSDDADKIDVATLMQEINDTKQINDPNYVKVVTDKNQFALYFSRSPIPYLRNAKTSAKFYEHIGIYAFKKKALLDFYQLGISLLEDTEKLEPLRLLENGLNIKCVVTGYMGIEIDTPADLEKANKKLTQENN